MNTREPGLQKTTLVTETIQTRYDKVDSNEKPEEPISPPYPRVLISEGDFEIIEKYNMRHKMRGFALIFNHEFFDDVSLKRREDAERDGIALKETAVALGFEARYYKDLNLEDLMQIVIIASKEDHSDSDCFLVAVMSHGEEGGLLYAKDHPFSAESVWNMFTDDRVPSLAGKPKIFLFQACRGKKLTEGVWLAGSPQIYDDFGATNADFLIVHATMEGYLLLRSIEERYMFIQELCEESRRHFCDKDLMSMMTFVLRRVSHNTFSNVRANPHMSMSIQLPVIMSTLTRLVYF